MKNSRLNSASTVCTGKKCKNKQVATDAWHKLMNLIKNWKNQSNKLKFNPQQYSIKTALVNCTMNNNQNLKILH